MRLVDLDALRDEWDAYAVDQYHLRPDARDDADEVIRRIDEMLDAAPMTRWHWLCIGVLALVGSWLALVAIWCGMALFSYLAGALGL